MVWRGEVALGRSGVLVDLVPPAGVTLGNWGTTRPFIAEDGAGGALVARWSWDRGAVRALDAAGAPLGDWRTIHTDGRPVPQDHDVPVAWGVDILKVGTGPGLGGAYVFSGDESGRPDAATTRV